MNWFKPKSFLRSAQVSQEAWETLNKKVEEIAEAEPDEEKQKVRINEFVSKFSTASAEVLDLIKAEVFHSISNFFKTEYAKFKAKASPELEKCFRNTAYVFEKNLMYGVVSAFLSCTRESLTREERHQVLLDLARWETEFGKSLEPDVMATFEEHGIAEDVKTAVHKMFYYSVPVTDVLSGEGKVEDYPSASLSKLFYYLNDAILLSGQEYEPAPIKAVKLIIKYDPDVEEYMFNLLGEDAAEIITPGQDIVIPYADKRQAQAFLISHPKIRDFATIRPGLIEGEPGRTTVHTERDTVPPFLRNVEMTPQGIPKGYTLDFWGWDRIRDQIAELLKGKRYEEVLQTMGPTLTAEVFKDLEKRLAEAGETEELAELEKKLPTIQKMVHPEAEPEPKVEAKAKPSIFRKKAVYDIIPGDTVVDPKYGEGEVTGITELEEGVVEVTFGPNVKIAHYPAIRIAKPCIVDSEIVEFKCPMDLSVITAEACLGEMEKPCSFLKYIDDKPHCCYQEEMGKMRQQAARKSAEKHLAEVKVISERESMKKYLQELTKDSSFAEHRAWLKVEDFSPIRLHSNVIKKGTEILGEVIERNADASVMVKWENGRTTVNWENELNATQRKAYTYPEMIYGVEDWKEIPIEILKGVYETAATQGRVRIPLGVSMTPVMLDDIHKFLKEQGAFGGALPEVKPEIQVQPEPMPTEKTQPETLE